MCSVRVSNLVSHLKGRTGLEGVRVWGEVTGDQRKLHCDELCNLFCSPDTVRMIQSKRWEGHVACMRQKINAHMILVGEIFKEREHVQDLDMVGMVM